MIDDNVNDTQDNNDAVKNVEFVLGIDLETETQHFQDHLNEEDAEE